MIRPYRTSDAIDLRQIFEQQGIEYECLDFNDRSVLSKVVFEKDGKAGMAILCRLTAEAYFLMDKEFGLPDEKWAAFLQLHEAAREDCLKRGLTDVYCWVPPMIAKSFGRRLMRIGWGRNLWPSFTRKLDLPTHDKKEDGPCVYLSESQAKLLAGE